MEEASASSSPGPSRTVTFQSSSEMTARELDILQQVRAVLDRDEAYLLGFIRKVSDIVSVQDTVERVVNAVFDKETSDPVMTCDKASTSDTNECMALVPITTTDFIVDKEHSDMQIAMQRSLTDNTSYLPRDLSSVQRKSGRSAGLLNLGNTCWLNSFVQLLYSIPALRTLTYHFVPLAWTETPMRGVPEDKKGEVNLLLQLRSLFAKLKFTKIAYLKPNDLLEAVDTIHRAGNKEKESLIGRQHDSVEMCMFLTSQYELVFNYAMQFRLSPRVYGNEENFVVADSTADAPNSDVGGTAPPAYDAPSIVQEVRTRENTPNKSSVVADEPMDTSEPLGGDEQMDVDPGEQEAVERFRAMFDTLFLAKYSQSTVAVGGGSTTESTYTNRIQFIQLSASYKNLHDALEETCFVHNAGNKFTLYDQLPAVLMLSLNRSAFSNTERKVHDMFTFPRKVYMDRYLKCNEQKILEIRERLSELRNQLAANLSRKRGLLSYPHGDEKETKLYDAFKTVQEALTNAREKEDPKPQPETEEFYSSSFIGPILPSAYNVCNGVGDTMSNFVKDQGKMFPSFNEISFPDVDLCVNTLSKAMSQLECAEQNLLREEARLTQEIEEIYERLDLMQHGYYLKGIIVHKGSAQSGHYYSFLKKHTNDDTEEWERLNDKNISPVSWDTIKEESFGTGNPESPSAYLLMYLRSGDPCLTVDDSNSIEESLENLPDDLREEVMKDEENWENELHRFRETKTKPFPKKETFAFSWCRNSIREDPGDENANPKVQLPLLSKKLVDNHFFIKEPDMIEVDRVTQHVWNTIARISPDRVESAEKLLEFHLKQFTDTNSIKFIEKDLGFNLSELKEDAENDFQGLYDLFIVNYIACECMAARRVPRTNFIFFVSVFPQINFAVLRYLIVRATALSSSVPHYRSRAQMELEEMCSDNPITYARLEKVAVMLAAIFELGSISVYASNKALEYYTKVMHDLVLRDSTFRTNTVKEQSYLAMVYARTARVAARVVNYETDFLKKDGISFVTEKAIQMCTFLPFVVQASMLINFVMAGREQDEEISFRLSRTEQMIPANHIKTEMRGAAFMVLLWQQNYDSEAGPLSLEDLKFSPNDYVDFETTLPDLKLDMTLVHGFFESTLEKLSNLKGVTISDDRKRFVGSIYRALKSLERFDPKELPGQVEKFPLGNVYEDLKKLRTAMAENLAAVEAVRNITTTCKENMDRVTQ